SSSASESVPSIEFVFKMKLSLNILANSLVSPILPFISSQNQLSYEWAGRQLRLKEFVRIKEGQETAQYNKENDKDKK
ncbi:MAG: hypothetical protein ACEY3E_05135, partial [Candidatus Tisiphia sp.]